jgi:hypothetical protein
VALFEVVSASSKRELTVGDLTDAIVKWPPMNGMAEESLVVLDMVIYKYRD